ncbi:hypothetical protein [Pseudoalteromonas sp. SaAl2]
MDLSFESFFDTVISMSNLDKFTPREISIGFCCFARVEHFTIPEIQKKVSRHLIKLTKKGLLNELATLDDGTKEYVKTALFHSGHAESFTTAKLKIQFMKDCKWQENICRSEMLSCDGALERYANLYGNCKQLKETMKPACDLLHNRRAFLRKKADLIIQLHDLYDKEVNEVLKSGY